MKFKNISIVLLVLSLSSCVYYSYAIQHDDNVRTDRYSNRIFDNPYFTIDHSHFRSQWGALFSYRSYFELYLEPPYTQEIVIENITLIHRKENGKIIPGRDRERDLLPLVLTKHSSYWGINYMLLFPPKIIIEEIKIKFRIDGELFEYEEAYILEKEKAFTDLDVLMSV